MNKYATKRIIKDIQLIIEELEKTHKLEDGKFVSYALFRVKKWLEGK